MANETPEAISYIKIGEKEHPIDAITVGGKSASNFQEASKIVQSISASSTDEQIPSAKCIYDIIYGASGGGTVTNNNYIKVTVRETKHYVYTATIDEIGTDYNINNSPEIYVNNTIIDNWYIYNNNTIIVPLNEINIHTSQLYLSPANYPTNADLQGAGYSD